MERVITIQEAVVLKSGTSKRGPWTLSAVKDENGQGYTTFKNELRELAQGNIGATAKILFTENDGKVNLEGLEILSKASVSPSNGTGQNPNVPDQLFNVTRYDGAEKEKRIMRQSAAKIAAQLEAAHPDPEGFDFDHFSSIADQLVDYFENGRPVGVPFGE